MEEDRYIRITLRIPRELHTRLDFEAMRTSKSLNAEIVGRLEETFRAESRAMNEELLFEMRRTQVLMEITNLNVSLAELRLRSKSIHDVIHDPSSSTEALIVARDELQKIIDEREPIELKEEIARARLAELDALKSPYAPWPNLEPAPRG